MSAVSVERIPRIAPVIRIRRVSARVSIPSTPSLPCRSRNAFRVSRERQLLGYSSYSRTTNPFEMDPGRLHVLRIDPGVADQRIGHRDDLPLVGGVGEDLLVAGHPRVEDDLPQDLALSGKGRPPVNASVLQDQQGLASLTPQYHAPLLHAQQRGLIFRAYPPSGGSHVREFV